MLSWIVSTCLLAGALTVDAAPVDTFVKKLKKPAVSGYPKTAPCSKALGVGGRCVGRKRYACQPGLACFRWKRGMGRCYKPSWLKSAKVKKQVFQVSTGCKGGKSAKTPKGKKPTGKKPTGKKPTGKKPSGGSKVPGVFKTGSGKCPRNGTPALPAGKPQTTLNVPKKAQSEYNGATKIPLKYKSIGKGGTYCGKKGSKGLITFGGTLLFKAGNKCYKPPTKAGKGNKPCCVMKAWQPNSRGFYYDNCSMKMSIGGDGLYWFKTEMPGDESKVGWGPDPMPHIHYSIECKGCKKSKAFKGTSKVVANKVYPKGLCKIKRCGNPGGAHKAKSLGKGVYKYDIVL